MREVSQILRITTTTVTHHEPPAHPQTEIHTCLFIVSRNRTSVCAPVLQQFLCILLERTAVLAGIRTVTVWLGKSGANSKPINLATLDMVPLAQATLNPAAVQKSNTA